MARRRLRPDVLDALFASGGVFGERSTLNLCTMLVTSMALSSSM